MAAGNGRPREPVLRLALAQTDCTLGDVEANARRVRETLAAAADADLVVFPELTLTGYQLAGVSEDVSLPASDPEIGGLAANAPACVVGFAEAGRLHTYNTAAYL